MENGNGKDEGLKVEDATATAIANKCEEDSPDIERALIDKKKEGKCCGIVLTNFQILGITGLLFAAFVCAETIGALASGSLSLLGDAGAMSVDVFSYGTNMYAEKLKQQGRNLDESTRFVLEVYIPAFSVVCLLAVTGWITSDAIGVIMSGGEDDVDVAFLYGFAIGNFFVDVASSWLFYLRGEDALKQRVYGFSADSADPDSAQKVANLNMISAITHVGGDSMRTTSVFVAAVIASASNIDSGLLDAWAAIVVTVTIVIAVIPLIKEIIGATKPHARSVR